jgi:hypothetical protein
MIRTISLAALFFVAALASGCASVPMANAERDTQAKTFAVPATGKANVYVYRNEVIGGAVKMDLALNGKPIGQTTAMTFVVLEVAPGKHNLVSKAENESRLDLVTEAGKNYFVWQEVKMGVLYARNLLQLVDEKTGRAGVAECRLIEAAK